MAVRPLFILSLPRAGSTLLQRILAAQPSVATTSEPWLLLPQVYATRGPGARAEYGHLLGVRALQDFVGSLPEGADTYRAALRSFALELYGAAADGAAFFIDKTPRYSLICHELRAVFPDARFVVLWRNPLAVAASMIRTWGEGRWNLHAYRADLYRGLASLIDFVETEGGGLVELRYEDLVADPEREVRRVCRETGIEFRAETLGRLEDVGLEGRMGDPTGVDRWSRVSDASLGRWPGAFGNPLRRRWARRYLSWIGDGRLARMGYDRAEIEGSLRSERGLIRHLASDAARMPLGTLRARVKDRVGSEQLGRWADPEEEVGRLHEPFWS